MDRIEFLLADHNEDDMLNFFPSIQYNFGVTGGTLSAVDIFKCVNINLDDMTSIKSVQPEQYERPDQLSYKLYGLFDYYWVLMLTNKIKDPINDWDGNYKLNYPNKIVAEKIKNTVRDSTDRIINIKLSEI